MIPFASWQANLHEVISYFPKFSGVEISTTQVDNKGEWKIIQQFEDAER